MPIINDLLKEAQALKKLKPKSGNFSEMADKERFVRWSENCLLFFNEISYTKQFVKDFRIASQSFSYKKMTGILNDFLKHKEELTHASPIIKLLGFDVNYEMCDDAPDIVLPSREERLIGLEVTEYVHRSIAEVHSMILRGEIQPFIIEEQDIDNHLLTESIKEKENKLKKYKADPRNAKIDTYILVIVVPLGVELIDIDLCEINTRTDYDSIYIIDDGKYKKIK